MSKPKSFFLTSEYAIMDKAAKALTKKNTIKNMTYFQLYKMKSILLAGEFGDVGFNKSSNNYSWLTNMDEKTWAKPNYGQAQFNFLWKKHWPKDGELNEMGLLAEVREL